MKATPKSCGCRMCKYGKRTKGGKHAMRADERSFRHNSNQALRCGAEVLNVAPAGGRYG